MNNEKSLTINHQRTSLSLPITKPGKLQLCHVSQWISGFIITVAMHLHCIFIYWSISLHAAA